MTLVVLLVMPSLPGVSHGQAPLPAATVRVEGRVVDSLGDPVSLAQVIAATPRGGIELARVQADGDGAFVMPRLPRKKVVLRTSAARRLGEPLLLEFDERPWCELSAMPVLLRMNDAVTLRGLTKDENGKPLAKARVLAQRPGERVSWGMADPFVETDALGRFEISVPLGRATVCAIAANHEVVVEQLTLTDDQTLDFILPTRPSCELRINYRGAMESDLDSMAFVEQGDFEPDLWQSWPQTRSDGAVVFHGLPIDSKLAKFRVDFMPDRITNTSYVVPTTPGRHTIDAPLGPWENPDDPLVELRGRLVDTDGKPVRGARLSNWLLPQPPDVTPTDDEGRFSLSFRSKFLMAWIRLDGEDYVPMSPRLDRKPDDCLFGAFVVPFGGKQDLLLVAEKAATIAGRLLDAAKQPVWGASIELCVGDGDYPSASSISGLTDRDGRFTLRGLRASGRLKLWVRATWPDGEFATDVLQLGAGQTLSLGDLRVGKPNTIEGELPRAGGGARACEPITLVRDLAGRPYETWRRGVTDRRGRFRFAGLPEGDYTVRVGWPGGERTGPSPAPQP